MNLEGFESTEVDDMVKFILVELHAYLLLDIYITT